MDPGTSATARVTRADQARTEHHEWGVLTWMVSAALGNSTTMTVGQCRIHPGQANPRHLHPNCDEVLHVLAGRIRHSLGDEVFEMGVGDTVSIPQGTLHNAANIGDEDAVLAISFSSAQREVIGE